jgi:hypothetical protein
MLKKFYHLIFLLFLGGGEERKVTENRQKGKKFKGFSEY